MRNCFVNRFFQRQLTPAEVETIEQAKYYRLIGEHEKARELFRSLSRSSGQISPQDQGWDKTIQFTVTKEDPAEQNKGVDLLWESTDKAIVVSLNNERYPFLEARYNSAYDQELYHVCEYWQVVTAPDKIRLARSMNHGYNWSEAYLIDSDYELSTPEIKQVSHYYMGVVSVFKLSDSDYHICFERLKTSDFSEHLTTWPDASSGTIDRGPHLATDYLDYGDAAYAYIVYFRIAGSNSKLMFVRSLDAGRSWEEPVPLWNLSTIPVNYNNNASLAYDSDGAILWVAFSYYSGGKYYIRVLKSTDFGQTWSSPGVYDTSIPINNVSITAESSSEAWIIYNLDYGTDQDTKVLYTSDGGSSFTASNLEASFPYDSRYGRIRYIEGSSYVYAAFLEMYNDEVYIYRAHISSPTVWSNLGNVKNSSYDLDNSPVAILVSQNPSGTYDCSVSWCAYIPLSPPFPSNYNVYFDAGWLPLATSTKMSVIPSNDFYSGGAGGGPFLPLSMDYLIENTGTETVNYTVSKNQNWVTLSNTSGSLNGGNAVTVTVSINDQANSLPLGSYTATVTFTNTTNVVGNTTRYVYLTVASTGGSLQVTPTSAAYFYMFRGGPIPSTTSYMLQNTGGTTIDYLITKTKNWLSIARPTSSSLLPNQSTSKTISVDVNSLNLTQGTYTDTLTFKNTTNSSGNTTRGVTLDVNYNMWVTVMGTTNQIYQREMTTTGLFLSWRALAGYTNKTPASAIFINRDYIIVKSDINNDIWYNYILPDTSRTMGTWTKLPGATPDKPAAAVFNNKLYVVVRGDDNKIYVCSMTTGGSWSSWSPVPGGYTNVPPAIAAFNNYLYLIVKDAADNKIWWNKMNTAGTWSGWQLMSGMSPSTAAMTEFNGQLYIVVRGSDSRLYLRSMSTSEVFTAWAALAGWTDDSPAICSFNNLLYLVVKGLGSNDIWSNSMTASGTWGTWTKMDGASPTTATLAAPKID